MSGAVITNDYGRFAQIPLVLAFDPLITPNAVKLYSILWGYSSAGDRQAFPSRETIAKHMGRSTDTVDRGLKELVAYKAIAIEHAFDRGRQVANVYRILNLSVSRPDLFDPSSSSAPPASEQAAPAEDEASLKAPATAQEAPDEADPGDREHRPSGSPRRSAPRGAAPVRPRGRNRAGHGGRTGAEGIYEQEPEEQESSSSVPASPPGAGESSPTMEEDSSSPPVVDAPPRPGSSASAGSATAPPGVGGGAVVAGDLSARLRAAGIDPGYVDLDAARDEVLGARMGHRIGNRTAYVAAAIIREPWRWPPAPGTSPPPQRAADRLGAEGVDSTLPAQPVVVRKRVASSCPRCGHGWLWWEPATGVEDCPDCEHFEDGGPGPDQDTSPVHGKVA